MNLRNELAEINGEKIEEIFDDIFPSGQEVLGTPEENLNFILTETSISAGQFPVFKIIFQKTLEMGPRMIADGVLNKDRLQGMLMGITVVQLVLSGYAEREVPDSIPPGFES